MTKQKHDEIVNFTNSLSNEDLVHLINLVAPRLMMWVQVNDCAHCEDVESACLNGGVVQLNPKQN